MTFRELLANHLAETEWDSAEVVRQYAENLVRAYGVECRIYAVDLAARPPVVRVLVTHDIDDEDVHCRQVHQFLGDVVRVEPHIRKRPVLAS